MLEEEMAESGVAGIEAPTTSIRSEAEEEAGREIGAAEGIEDGGVGGGRGGVRCDPLCDRFDAKRLAIKDARAENEDEAARAEAAELTASSRACSVSKKR